MVHRLLSLTPTKKLGISKFMRLARVTMLQMVGISKFTVFNSHHPSEGECNHDQVENSRIPKEEEISEKGGEELAMSFLSGERIAEAMKPTTTQEGPVKMEESVEHDWCEESLLPDVVKGTARILHFEHVMNFSTSHGRCALNIPTKFAASNGLYGIKQLFLRDPNGQLWPVRICHRRSSSRQLTGCGGWRDFCIGNNVRDGDICSFQLEGKNELHVKIHRRHQLLMRNRGTPTPNIVDGGARISHFEVVIDFSLPYRRYMIRIPAQFVASNGLSHVKHLVLRDPHGQLWPLRISHGRQAMAYAGWLDFCIGNNLQDGDVCLFQFKGKAEIHVQICRRRHQKSMKVSRDTSRKSERLLSRHSASGSRKSERYHQVHQFTCTITKSYYRIHSLRSPPLAMAANRNGQQAPASLKKPQFFKILLPCFLHRLRIPEGFNKYIAGGHMPRKATILSPLGGQPWTVQVHSTTDHNCCGRFLYFGAGWQEFSHAHDLDVGDLVLFTYEGEMVFTATVFDRTTCTKEYVYDNPVGEGSNKVDGGSFYCDAVAKPSERDALHERSLSEILRSMDSQNHDLKVASCGEGSQFEIILSSSCNPCEEPSLLLPQQFVKHLGEENGTLATIFSTNGKAWHIKVNEDGKGYHFADGWQRLAEAHNLGTGDSLVFKHIGGLLFDVTVLFNNHHPSEGECNHDQVENSRIPKEEEISEKGYDLCQYVGFFYVLFDYLS